MRKGRPSSLLFSYFFLNFSSIFLTYFSLFLSLFLSEFFFLVSEMNELDQEEDKVINDRVNSRRRVSKKGQKFQISMRHVVSWITLSFPWSNVISFPWRNFKQVCNSHDFNVASKLEGASHMFRSGRKQAARQHMTCTWLASSWKYSRPVFDKMFPVRRFSSSLDKTRP